MLDHAIEISEDSGVRYLHFGSSWIQGAMRIRRPQVLELAYTREMMACLLLRRSDNWPERVLLVGLGAGSLTKFIHLYLPATRITVVEIDPRIPLVAAQHFRLPTDPRRLKVVIADGAEYIHRNVGRFDAIFLDGFGANGRAGELDSLAFYLACRNKLTDCGLMICNLLGHNRGFMASVERIHRAFDKRSIVFPSVDSGNAIAFAATGEPIDTTLMEMRNYATTLKKNTGLDLRPTISRLELAKTLRGDRLAL